ncbi:CHASE2 domain-containing protein [Phenylobacterium aquaticum]|uniref:CHASE2 domain-containing protein n=1 Tax=Phenylobacterium aquaticum TaxID=1763816 RepID=UPI0026E9AE29|nr:CHASE2 domain-containing protein [Phenylobacterium aquaticum]
MARRPGGGPRSRLMREWLVVAATASLIVAGCALTGLFARADNLVYDRLMALAPLKPDPRVVIVAIDDRSLAEIGRWPWGRDAHARLLEVLAQSGPKAVIYDVLFLEPSDQDAALAAAMAKVPTVLPVLTQAPGPDGAAFAVTPPTPALARAAAGLGQVNVRYDADGLLRRVHLRDGGPGHWIDHLALKGFRLIDPHAPSPPDALLVPFAGPPGSFPTIAFASVLRGEVPPQAFRGRIVLVGATAAGMGDRFPTPVSGHGADLSGVEFQANVVSALLQGREIRPLPAWAAALFALGALLALLVCVLRLAPRAAMAAGGVIGLLVLGVSAGLLMTLRVWLPPVPALAGLVLVYPLWGWRRLAAASAFLGAEIDRLAADPAMGPAAADPAPAADLVGRQAWLLEQAIDRMSALRRFAADALTALPDATLVLDAHDRVEMANAAARTLFAAAGPMEGRSWPDLADTLPLADLEPIPQALASDGRELRLSDGRTLQVGIALRQAAPGEAAGRILRFADVTALESAHRQREQALQLLTHDMRSPQSSILALLDNPRQAGGPEALSARIAGYARRTLALADGFVQLARAESSALRPVQFDLADLLVQAVDDLWPQWRAKGLNVETKAPESVIVLGDEALTARAIGNLLGNAVKFSPEGGRITCVLARGRGARAAYWVLKIADEGPGLSAQDKASLFEPFKRFGDGKTEGVGLGLSFVRVVAQRQGGFVDCDSAPGRGAIFAFGVRA